MEYKINLSHFNFKDEDITYEVLEQTVNKIISKTSYSNGLYFIFTQTISDIEVKSNWTLKLENDGSITPVKP